MHLYISVHVCFTFVFVPFSLSLFLPTANQNADCHLTRSPMHGERDRKQMILFTHRVIRAEGFLCPGSIRLMNITINEEY